MELVDIAARLLDGGSVLALLYILLTERERNAELVDWMREQYEVLLKENQRHQ